MGQYDNNSIGYGAGAGMETVLARLYAQQKEKQRALEAQAELEQRQRGYENDEKRLKLEERRLDDAYNANMAEYGMRGTEAAAKANAPVKADRLETDEGFWEQDADGAWKLVLKKTPKPAAAKGLTTVRPGEVLYDEATGEVKYTAPRAPESGGTLTGTKIDPAYPPDIQLKVNKLRSMFPTYDQALASVNEQFDRWKTYYPDLSPQKVAAGLRDAYSGGAAPMSPEQRAIAQEMEKAGLGGESGAGGAGASRAGGAGPGGGGRGAAVVTPPAARPAAAAPIPNARVGEPQSTEALQGLVSAAVKAIEDDGRFPATPENVKAFLSDPANVQMLQRTSMQQGQAEIATPQRVPGRRIPSR